MAVLEEEEETERNRIQRNGFVAIVYHIGPFSLSEIDRSLYWQGLCSLQQLPLRISGGIHYCFDDYTIRQATSLFMYRLREEEDRARYHLHDGESLQHASFYA
jgi:hypothetical protein